MHNKQHHFRYSMSSADEYVKYRKGCKSAMEANSLGEEIIRKGISHQESQARYQEWAQTYDSDLGLLDYEGPELVADELASYLRRNKDARILDCAAGTGRLGVHLNKLGFTNLEALDASPQMLNEAEKKHVYKRTIVAKLGGSLDIEDAVYDGIVITGAFYEGHVSSDCIPELIRITKPGGVLVLCIPNESFLGEFCQVEKRGMWRQLMKKIILNFFEGNEQTALAYQRL